MAGAAGLIHEGLKNLQEQTKAAYPDVARFSDLSFARQTEVLRSVETSPFFATVHMMTLSGLFALPDYGGNRDKLGWKLIGFDDRHVWQPPFGYYDANYHGDDQHAGS